jgi:hypothetical protein
LSLNEHSLPLGNTWTVPPHTEVIADCDRKIRNYRQLLDDEDAVALAAQWIAETQRERKALERQLGEHIPGGELTAKEVKALVDAL